MDRAQTLAVPIVSERISLPSAAGTANLLDLLPPDLATLYRNPSPDLIRADWSAGDLPRSRVFGQHDEYVSLVRRMHRLGMVSFTKSPRVVNGVFAVPKDEHSDRLIVDARAANAVFTEPPKVELPTPDLLAQLTVMDSTQPVYVAKVDLDNFYHKLALPQWMWPYFALPAVTADEVGLTREFGAGARIFPCCTTLPMGWSHSVFAAQQSHEHTVNARCTLLRPEDRITTHTDNRLDRTRHLIYIDDVILLGPQRHLVAAAQDQYVGVVDAVGTPHKPSKKHPPTCDGLECVGLVVHGRDFTVGADPVELRRLSSDTLALLSRGRCSGLELASLVGRWTWAALACRPALATLSSVYRFIERAGRRVFFVWPSVERELDVLVGLAPFLHSRLDQDWFPHVIATDASSTGIGIVACNTGSQAVRTAATSRAVLQPEAGTPPAVCNDLRWSTIVSRRWREAEHINVLEMRAVSTALRWALSRPVCMQRRILLLCDSQVVVGCLVKGRSSSPPLLRLLRLLAALQIASGSRFRVLWIRSETNPADDASRRC